MIISEEVKQKKYYFREQEYYVIKSERGLTREIVEKISEWKKEPEWMKRIRLRAFEHFVKREMPNWGPDLSNLNLNDIVYFYRATEKKAKSWEDLPEPIKKTFEKLGIPEAERRFLAGLGAQYESEVVYHKLKESLEKEGVIFCDMDTAVKKYPEIVKEYFGKVVPFNDNKFAALNTSVWSGGSFVYVPKNVEVKMPLHAYFRINAPNLGQFERTLIIAEENSKVEYVEGCTAPSYQSFSLHAAVVEIIAKKGAKVKYTTIQNWSKNVYNLVTKRAFAYEDALVEWIDYNGGSFITMKYPSVFLLEKNAKAEIISIALAGKNQIIDSGAKVIHLAPNTSSIIISKSISKDGGKTTYRGLVKVQKGAKNVKCNVRCDALILDKESVTETIPYMEINEKDCSISHEASISKVDEEKIFYLTSKGLKEKEAINLIVKGFIEEFTKKLPFEYAIEMNRLIDLEMEGSLG